MTKEKNFLYRLSSALGLMQQSDEKTFEPAFIGPVPYLLLLRILIFGAIPLRFWIHRNQYTKNQSLILLLLISLTAILVFAMMWVTFNRVLRRSKSVHIIFITLDILLISVFYFLTNNPQSDFFLFYYLPILTTAEYLGQISMIVVFSTITVAFASILTLMIVTQPDLGLVPADLFIRVFIPRWVFYVSVVMATAYLLRIERKQRERACKRELDRTHLLATLGEIGEATTGVIKLDSIMDSILEHITEKIGFEFATISLVDDYRGVIETVRGKNVPPGWIERAKHNLDSGDIQAYVVRKGNFEVIEGWDDRFDKEIYNGFGHKDLARVFAPLVADGRAIGTIEAGCQLEKREKLLTSQNIRLVKRIGQDRGKAIAHLRPHILLELIANHAIKIIGADSASIHVYRLGNVFLEAGAGIADKDFLHRFPPRPKGIGRKAMESDRYVVLDDPQELFATNSNLYNEGIRAIAAFPLSLQINFKGVLYIHFWKEHRFNKQEIDIERIFTQQMEVAIQHHLLLSSISKAAQRAWTITGLQNVIQSLAFASRLDLIKVLQDVAQNILYMLGANSVTMYQYYQEERQFVVPPIMKGTFKYPKLMYTRICPDDIVWSIVKEGQPQFFSDVSSEPILSNARSDGENRPRFVEREGIVSSGAIVLRAGEKAEIVGLLFINYCTSHNFSEEERKTINTLASSAAVAIKTSRLYSRIRLDLEKQISTLHTLNTIATRIQIAKQPLEKNIHRLVLTGITAREGLGFSRAMLFLTNPDRTALKGTMAIGALTQVEAESTWRAINKEVEIAKSRGEDILKLMLDKAEELGIAIDEKVKQDMPLSNVIKQICMPLEMNAGALPTCVLQGKTIVVEEGQNDPLRRAIEQSTQKSQLGRMFACVPLAGIGALVVDKRFFENEERIDDDSVHCVEAFSSVLAMSIENARLIDSIAEQQKVETWKEFTGEVVHILGSRISIIEGSFWLLRTQISDNVDIKTRLTEPLNDSIEDLSNHIQKFKIVLNDFRNFPTPLELNLQKLDLLNFLEKVTRETNNSIDCHIKLELPNVPITILGDGGRLSDAFIEIIKNADSVMKKENTSSPKITITLCPTYVSVEPITIAHIEFIDNGPGVADEHKRRIFNPFFTQRGGGSGLGLSAAKTIIEEHNGTIEEVGVHGEGAKFIVRLPCVE